ncbi:MAG: GNAT family N-acetyltransferase [Alphaproteobacteria bacterium]|nr:GNAT family N-acetyltransferase [Alphaproteobacteria bacterium]MBV9371258.1 GNAT family N-acetyltransferase [Alphaproteobacteria bacterium]MBV9902803.1 GNAT family N-acetyltransferase [Alphaproteobacteria bacterium]
MNAAGAVSFALERPDAAALEAWWRDLEARADISFYLSWAWIGCWIAEAGPPDFVLTGRAGDEIVCLGLLRKGRQARHGFVRSRTLCLHETGREEQDVIYIEYNAFLADRRFDPLDAEAIAFLRSEAAALGGFDEIQLGGFAEHRYAAVAAAGHRTHVFALKTSAQVDLAAVRAAGGDYLATLSANSRQQIRRAVRFYEARGPLALEAAASVGEAKAWFEAMGLLHERAWRAKGEGGAWRFPFLLAFHRRLIDTAFPAGGVEIVRISCGGTPIGYIHCLVRGGWIGSYLSGFAYEADNKARPGLVSFALYIQHKLKSNAQVFDFLAGDHRYKTSLGTPGPRMYWFSVQEDRWQLKVEDALRQVKRRLLGG